MTLKTMNEQMEDLIMKIEALEYQNSNSITWSEYIEHRELKARKSQLQTDMKIVEELKKEELNFLNKLKNVLQHNKIGSSLLEERIDKLFKEIGI
jgi:hypothetical protein